MDNSQLTATKTPDFRNVSPKILFQFDNGFDIWKRVNRGNQPAQLGDSASSNGTFSRLNKDTSFRHTIVCLKANDHLAKGKRLNA